MSADLLRRAAAKLREHANDATRGPWEMDGADGLVWPGCMGDPVSGSDVLANGAFIALMHPPVALALAELLEHQADDLDDDRAKEHTFERPDNTAFKAIVNGHGTVRWDWTAAVALARAVLREPEVTP